MPDNKWRAIADQIDEVEFEKPHELRRVNETIAEALGWKRFMCGGDGVIWKNEIGETQVALPNWAGSQDALAAAIEKYLPGWMARVQWCSVSAEAWVAPDLNSPKIPQVYRDNESAWHDYADKNEVEYRPGSPSTAALALCAAFALAMSDREQP